jgi:hypothetical protein
MCRFDDECEKAKEPCPCCGHIKKMELSYEIGLSRTSEARGSSDIHPREQMPAAPTPPWTIPSHATDIIWGTKDDDFTARWIEEV